MYPGEALPDLTIEFRTEPGQPGPALDRVLPDTGADASVLPWPDCERLQLRLSQGSLRTTGGVGNHQSQLCPSRCGYILMANRTAAGSTRIFIVRNESGRDVLNRIDVLFRGPAGEVVVNP